MSAYRRSLSACPGSSPNSVWLKQFLGFFRKTQQYRPNRFGSSSLQRLASEGAKLAVVKEPEPLFDQIT